MGIFHIIAPILVGGAIGYFTNYIAIKMLFRPYSAKYIGKHRVPLTPGVIPRNQSRVARAAGEAVSEQLLTKETVLGELGEAGRKCLQIVEKEAKESEMSVRELLPEGMDSEEVIGEMSSKLAGSIMEKAKDADIDSIVEEFWLDAMGSMLGSAPMLARLFSADMQKAVCARLSSKVRNYLNEHGEELVKDFAADYLRTQAERPVGEILTLAAENERIKSAAASAAQSAASKYGSTLMREMDIGDIVAEKIEAMGMKELEELVLSVMKQELQAVINLGALIGALIGIINIFL